MPLKQTIKIFYDKLLNHGSSDQLSTQVFKGRFYVYYTDNKCSRNMSYSTAKEYAEIFDGTVKHISEPKPSP